MTKTLLALALAVALGTAHAAEGVSQAQFKALEARMAQLEADAKAARADAAKARAEAEAAQAEVARLKGASTANVAAPAAPTPGGSAATSAPAAADTSDLAANDDLAVPDDTASAAAPAPVATGESNDNVASADGGGSSSNPNAFNPAISIILNGSYTHHSLDPANYIRAGFPIVGEGGPAPDGFSLGESEISFAANIDEKFYGQLTLTAASENGQDHIGVEEAFIDTTALPAGWNMRLGRFYSNIGYLNSHHAHTDNFFDRPLAYQAFLGNQYGDDGVQVRWVAPTSLFFEVGGEAFRGESYPAAGAGHGGVGTKTLFAHVGGDVGDENEWLAGVSALRTSAIGGEDGFTGDGTLYIVDGTWKWAPQGNFKDGGLTLRSEYMIDHRDGTVVDAADPSVVFDWSGKRRGAYAEAVYRINRQWDVGYRFDRLWAANDGPFASDTDPTRHTIEATWRNSEFSLFRLQLSHDKPNAVDTDNAVTVQYQTSLGAHGAHKF
ncbi:hypothetical protein DWG18_09510 [Lysobacter sp. TY2-98]|uniref:hypothetical protein n=1 Tax=Lysobacter sp. TY2-98 TaxID=2290922 RepID=UPI000E20183D|nr:hypothetical protein [Lysobacter sp. TY2-98]AXK72484.1 hypothetical protein DWG18_09510 [Lysobacter sp. TY2-98]